ncbi:MAG: CARDB domain-containing protein [Euryarchaeota archaeon]|nr:CARDB domain-containing protein [Euryarchaeota archaeon]
MIKIIIFTLCIMTLPQAAQAADITDINVTDITPDIEPVSRETVDVTGTVSNNGSEVTTDISFFVSFANGTKIETEHPYPEDEVYPAIERWNLTHPGADRMRVRFSRIGLYYAQKFKDHIIIKDSSGSVVQDIYYPESYYGSPREYELEGLWSTYVDGDAITIELHIGMERRDWHRTYGFEIDKYEYSECFHTEQVFFEAIDEKMITAEWDVPYANCNLTIIADHSNTTAEPDETNNELTKSMRPKCRSDLAVTEISFIPSQPDPGENVSVIATIENFGDDAPSFIVRFCVDGEYVSSTSMTGLSKESSTTATMNRMQDAGCCNITVVIATELDEFDESNNIRTANLCTTLPDLLVTDLTTTPAGPVSGGAANISVGLANAGMIAADATLMICDGGAVPYSVESAHNIPDIDQSIIITHPGAEWIKLHFSKIEVIGNGYVEIYDRNDILIKKYTYTDVSHVTEITSPYIPGDTVHVRSVAGAKCYGFSIDEYLYFGGVIYNETHLFGVGETFEVATSWNATPPGSHNITATIDPDNSIFDEDRGNNDKSIDVIVRGADFHISSLLLGSTSAADGDEVPVTATIPNTGVLSACCSVAFFEDYTHDPFATVAVTLDPGDSQEIEAVYYASAGRHVITAYADWDCMIPETCETNNTATVALDVTGAEIAASLFTHHPAQPKDMGDVTLSAVIGNEGIGHIDSAVAFLEGVPAGTYSPSGVCGANSTFTVTYPGASYMGVHITRLETEVRILTPRASIKCDQPGWVWVSGDAIRVQIDSCLYHELDALFYAGNLIDSVPISLDPGESTTVSAEWTAATDNNTLVAFADPEEILPEGNEIDNSVVLDVWVQPTMDFALTGIDVVPPYPYDDDLTSITTRVRNQGVRADLVGINISEHQTTEYTGSEYGGVRTIIQTAEEVRIHFEKLIVPGVARLDITDGDGTVLHSYVYGSTSGYESRWSPWFAEPVIRVVSIGGTTANPVIAEIDRYECRNTLLCSELWLDVNETAGVTAEWNATTGYHNIVAALDSAGDLDEGNNIINKTVYVTPSKDPAAIAITTDPNEPVNGDRVLVNATIANHGIKSSECDVEVWNYRYENHTIETPHSFDERYSRTWTVSHPGVDFIGLHFAEVSTNVSGEHTLRMYDHNGTLLADWSYTNRDDAWVWARGDKLAITLAYNSGSPPYGFLVDKYRYRKLLNREMISLDSGETKEIASTWDATTGEHTIEVVVDPGDVLKEMSENNNILNRTITVSGPDMVAEGITFYKGDVCAVVGNAGISTAEDITVCMVTDCCDRPIESGWLGEGYPQEMSRTIHEPDAERMRVHFEDIRMNGYLYIINRSCDIVSVFSGRHSDVWSPWVHGNSITVAAHATDNPLSKFKVDRYEYGFEDATIDDLGPGESVPVPVTWGGRCGNLTAIVDPDDEIIESDGDNNEYSKWVGPDIFIHQKNVYPEDYYEKKRDGKPLSGPIPEGMGYSPKHPSINHECIVSGTIRNKGMIPTGEFEVALFVNDSVTETKEDSVITELGPNEKKIIDFSWTPDTNGTFDVTIRADLKNMIKELDEGNNNRTREIPVYKCGYAGGWLSTYDSGEINGSVIFSIGDSMYLSSGGDSKLTVNFDNAIPDDAKIALARLYLYWGFGHTGDWSDDTAEPAPLEADMQFNGRAVSVDREYMDEATNYAYGVHCYDVTDFVCGTDVAAMTRNGPYDGTEYKSSIQGMSLLILYEDESALTKYWINEGCDILYSNENSNGYTSEECTVGALFEGEIDATMVNATLHTVLPYGGEISTKGGTNRLYFNDEKWDGVWTKQEGESKIALGKKDVTDHLKHEDNLAGIQDRGDFMIVANAFLTLRYAPDLIVSEISKPYAAVVGKEYLINASISNIANGNVGRFNVTFSVNGDLQKTVAIQGLAAGESVNASFLWHSPPTVGVLERIDVEVDPEDHVAEWDEDNNERHIDITVVEAGTGDEPGPAGSGGGTGGGSSGSENVEGYLMKGTAFGTKGSGTGGEFSLLDYLIRSGLSLAGVTIFISGYFYERRCALPRL